MDFTVTVKIPLPLSEWIILSTVINENQHIVLSWSTLNENKWRKCSCPYKADEFYSDVH